MYHLTKEEFLKLASMGKGNLIPIYREILADLETPVSAYFKIASKARYSFLLESVEGQEKLARYSFLAKDPEWVFRLKEKTAEILTWQGGQEKKETVEAGDNPLSFIRRLMARYRFIPTPGAPRFCGGVVGFVGYDMVRFFEKLPQKTRDDLGCPDMVFVLTRNLVIFDHLNHKIKVVSCASFDPGSPPEEKIKSYENSVQAIEKLIFELNQPLAERSQPSSLNGQSFDSPPPLSCDSKTRGLAPRPICQERGGQDFEPQSNLTKAQFETRVREAKKKIKAGDIIQVVLSQRFEVPLHADPFHIYRALRSLNPSPYMYYLNFDDLKIIGSSPELLVHCEEGLVETRPIAGTRRRGRNEKEDEALIQDLLNDPKEKAEHIMLVDLGRNDLGRVCERSTVKVSEFMSVEKYSHVMHLVSNVKGRLNKAHDALDVLKAAFPAGTVSGAPKIRAMEIIEELEGSCRGPYAGAVGYLSFSGNLDTCINIRTILVKGSKAYVQAGAGIVADSIPAKEYQETVNKAKAQILAIQMAHGQGM